MFCECCHYYSFCCAKHSLITKVIPYGQSGQGGGDTVDSCTNLQGLNLGFTVTEETAPVSSLKEPRFCMDHGTQRYASKKTPEMESFWKDSI